AGAGAGRLWGPASSTVPTPNGGSPSNATPMGTTPSTGTTTQGNNNTALGGAPSTFRGSFNGNTLSPQSVLAGSNTRTTATTNSAFGGVGGGTPSAFSAYYVNALAPGAPGVSSLSAFNVPIYSGNAQGGGNNLGSLNGFPSSFNSGFPLGNNPFNASAANPAAAAGRRMPSYTAAPGFAYRPAAPNQVQRDVTAVLA